MTGSTAASSSPLVLAVVDDLLFLSRIQEAARAAGVFVAGVRTAAQVRQGAPAAVGLVIDLDATRVPVKEILEALRGSEGGMQVPVVGFFSHVHAERAAQAVAAGCPSALPRSAFVRELPRILAKWAAAAATPSS
jgi:CheY-like chemotaxis protein